MKHIILEGQGTGAVVLDVADLVARLEQLPDPRDRRGKIYPLGMVLTLVILAKLAGEDKPSAITEWIRLWCDAFVKLFNCKHRRMPCLDIICGLLANISDEALEKAFNHYLAATYGSQQSQLVVIDRKTMRGTIPKGQTRSPGRTIAGSGSFHIGQTFYTKSNRTPRITNVDRSDVGFILCLRKQNNR